MSEMNLPYELIANLVRLRLGKNYSINPFSHLEQVPKPRKGNSLQIGGYSQ